MLKFIFKGAFVIAASGAAVGAFGFTNLYVFGDSLSDVGNDYIASGKTIPAPPYYMGRFSNGPIWIDDLAASLGLGPVTASLAGGTDYAYGGATVTSIGTLVPSIATQIQEFGASNTFKSTDLVSLWAGANDFLDGDTNAAGVVSGIETDLNSLYALGARNIIVPNMPALGALPDVQNEGALAVAAADALTIQFNTLLAGAISTTESSDRGLKIDGIDFYDYVNGILADPSKYGFTNITGQLIDQPTGTTGYLFWDGEHPTTQAHALLASFAVQSVPEPPAYMALGFGVLALVRRRRIRRA